MLIGIIFTSRNILNKQSEYKLNNVPLKLFPWEESEKPAQDKSFRIVQKGNIKYLMLHKQNQLRKIPF